MAAVIPWLLEREYQQHRNLDCFGLPETFEYGAMLPARLPISFLRRRVDGS